jgi:hypothetical protein
MKSTRNNQIKKEAVNQKIIFPKYLIWDGKKTLLDEYTVSFVAKPVFRKSIYDPFPLGCLIHLTISLVGYGFPQSSFNA